MSEILLKVGDIPAFAEPIDGESTAYSPRNPYAATKAGADRLVGAWHETFSLAAVVSNCSNN